MKIGTNLSGPSYFGPNQPFLNIFKTGNSWTPNAGTAKAFLSQLDASGYPVVFTTGVTSCNCLILNNLGSVLNPTYYPSGTYIFLYDGVGTFTFDQDFTKVTETDKNGNAGTGRIVLTASSTTAGTRITLTSTGSWPNYAKNFRLVYSPDSTSNTIGTREALLNSGEIFNPDFIARIREFKIFRFMDWLNTNGSLQTNWADRSIQNWVFWNDDLKFNQAFGNGGMVPIEICIALCNKIGADAWFNMPVQATTDYVTQFANLVHSKLNSNLNVYVEYANECWNLGIRSSALQTSIYNLGATQFPALSSDQFSSTWAYGVYRAVTFGKIWKNQWGADSGRVIRVLGGQAANNGLNHDFLLPMQSSFYSAIDPTAWSGTAGANVDVFATAPYFVNESFPSAWTDPAFDGIGLVIKETEAGGLIPDGSSSHTTAGTNTAYTVTSGQSLPATPANATIVCVNFNQASGANPTLAADGGTAYPIQDANGNATTVNSGVVNVVFTSKTSAGVVGSPGWRLQGTIPSSGCMGEALPWMAQNASCAAIYSIPLVAYEFGQQYLGDFAGGPMEALLYDVQFDPRMFDMYTSWMNSMASNGFTVANHFTDIVQYNHFGYFGMVDNVTKTKSPKYDALLQKLNPSRHGLNFRGGF